MRVVQVGKYYYPELGGIETHLYTLVSELKSKVDFEIVVSNTARKTAREHYEGVKVTRCAALGTVASTSLTPTMPLELSRLDYDVVHVHLPSPMGALGYLLSRKPHRHRLVVTYHSDVVRQQRLMKLYGPLVDRLLQRADVVIATSPNYRDTSPVLRRVLDRCAVVPYGIDLELFRRTEAAESRAKRLRARIGDGLLLIAVGRLIYYKGFDVAIRAVARVPGVRLVIVGDGPLRAELESLAASLGVKDRVEFAGMLPNQEVTPYFLAADVFLLPSVARSEAFGIVQIEAMACELPVINTSLDSGVPFVSRDGESGLTVPPSDHLALARAIEKLAAEPELRQRMGQQGRARAEREFSKETLARRMLDIYEGREASAV